jgi:hypothetical protein
VNQASDAFFAGPSLAGDQDGSIRVGDDGGVVQHAFQRRTGADDIFAAVRTLDFVFQITLFLG